MKQNSRLRAPLLRCVVGFAFAACVNAQEPARDAGRGFEGNWEVTHYDKEGKASPARYIAIARDWPLNVDREWEKGSDVLKSRPPRLWFRQRDPNSPLIYSGTHNRNTIGAVGEIFPKDGTVKFSYPYNEGTAEVRLTGPNTVQGRWTHGEKSGAESWRRAAPRIHSVQWRTQKGTVRSAYGEVGRMETHYNPDDWARGNRATWDVTIYGDDLWGYHVPWVDGYGVESAPCVPIHDEKSKQVIGVQITGHFWSDASPGRRTLHFDDFEIPFDLVVTGFPADKMPVVPELRFVRFSNGRYEPAAELHHGDEFCVEAVYKAKPPQAPGKVRLAWTDGQPREVDVVVTEDEKVFRSARLKLEPPAGP